MKRNKKEDILLNTDNDDISMLAEIQTDPDEVTAMERNTCYAFTQHGNVSICSNACDHWTPQHIEIDKCCIQEKTSHSGSLSDTGRYGRSRF